LHHDARFARHNPEGTVMGAQMPRPINYVALEILNQLGGGRFRAMTGAKNFTSGNRTLSFALPSHFATDGINRVRIELMATDTYTLTFGKAHGVSFKELAVRAEVYNDRLREVFTSVTGLDTLI